MNLLYVWDADYPWDIRVEKICKSLAKNGHTVHIAARNLNKLPIYETIDGLHVHRVRAWNNDHLNYLWSFPLFFSPIWRRFLHKLISKNNIELIIVRDLPLAIAAIWAGRKFNIPVILDMAEDYTAMMRDIWKLRKLQGLNLIVRNPILVSIVERYTFRNIDHILVVIDEAMDVINRGGGDVSNVTIVSNTPELSRFDHYKCIENKSIEDIENHYSAVYTGGIQMGRGIQTVVDAIPSIIETIPDFLFVIIGKGYATEELKSIIHERGVEKYVRWIGWVDHNDIFTLIKSCKIGVIPHLVTDHVQTTIPNKIFDYMGCGVPVVASNSNPMMRVISTEKCGLTFSSGDANSLTSVIKEIYKSDIDYGNKGEQAVKNKYNWMQDEIRLLDAVKIRRAKSQ